MPYSGPNDVSLPSNVRKLSAVRRRQWLHVYDSEKAKGLSDADAIVRANGVIKNQMGHSMAQGKHEGDASFAGDLPIALGLEGVFDGDLDAGLLEAFSRIEAGQECGDGAYASDWVQKVSQEESAYDPLGGTSERACASCRWFMPNSRSCQVVAGMIYHTGVSNRYEAVPASEPYIPQTQLVDASGEPVDFQDLFDQLTAGGMSLDVGWHATWTASYIDSLPDGSFAFIDPGGKKDADGRTTPRSLRHFPYKDSAGKLDEAHVRDALGRVPQSHISAVGKHAALVKLHGAARTLGIKLTADAPKASAASNEGGGIAGVARNAYRSILGFFGLEELSEPEAWEIRQSPLDSFQGRGELRLHEGTGDEPGLLNTPVGRLRYWTVSSNNFMPDNKGLGFPTAAQHEYVDWVWGKPEERMPELQGWHTPGTRLGQADWIDFDGHFRHSTGLIDVGREEIAKSLAADPEMAMSHGYVVVWDRHNRAKVYRSYEESVLPREYAGNSFTSFGLEEDDVAFSEPKKKFLRERLGLSETEVAARENRWEQFGQLLEGLGIGSHELDLYVAALHADDEEGQPAETADGTTTPPVAAAAQTVVTEPQPAAAAAVAQASNEGALPTETMTPESLVAMISSMMDTKLNPLAQAVHGLQEHQGRVEQLLPNARPATAAGFDATKGANGVPGMVTTPNGGVTLGQQARDGAPVDPLPLGVMQAIAAGAAEGGGSLESPISWLQKKLEGGHPLLNGATTEVRG